MCRKEPETKIKKIACTVKMYQEYQDKVIYHHTTIQYKVLSHIFCATKFMDTLGLITEKITKRGIDVEPYRQMVPSREKQSPY